ncbi:external alternative NAD(P)H-ubiquinone oxidoreductase B3, mitochondrial-like isoform X2 [Silene latifolia]|uniref:external alternative NAD(P)H-ubiquinone oxidoreductase B3, mitochondrial-like isoform X2 n=1 Tax=Silene latifolia TaxID=37657 RepID=UPI003D7750F4
MASSSFFRRANNVYHSHQRFLVAIAIVSTGGGTLAYTTYADARSIVDDAPKKKVVVLGTGWAATSFVKNLKNSSYDVHIVSPRNYFAFAPLLPSVTCGTVEARSIVEPIRNIAKKKNVRVQFEEAECYKIDPVNKKVYCRSATNKIFEGKEEFNVDYDYLVVAMGARSNTFNTPGVEENCHFLKANRRVLSTDEWLRVEGTNDIYALGDCATIQQRKVMEDIEEIIKKDNTDTLNVKELKKVIKDISERYPQIEIYMKRRQFKDIVELIKNVKGNDEKQESTQIDIVTFKKALSEVDAQMKNLPATAQVAAQQGEYLADCFNRMKDCEQNPEGPLRTRKEGRHRFHPFRYKHLGQFAPLGGEQTAAQLPGDYVIHGHSTQWLWYSVYASKLVSWRTRMLVVGDWMRKFIFGRDSSRI